MAKTKNLPRTEPGFTVLPNVTSTRVAKKIVHFYLLHTVNKSGLSSLPPLYNSIKNYRIFSPLAGLQKRSKFHEVQSSMETDFILTGNEP